ncbi:uncharacterized protein LOC110672629 [Hevea brasiliensis]|uniref:uncharacterized protein LOC110672629 n=1 Tax=Hevea brasiliensis TaxID=3981 RepID=UPI0025D29ADB|nr:uncharacterized protein LOC110672629 [Hevea brasiliensis]
MLLYQGRIYIPNDVDLKQIILQEAHDSPFSMHPGETKMYRTVKEHYWWRGMKKDITKFVAKCLICQQVKAEHQVLVGLLQPLPILEWKRERITMDFMIEEKIRIIRDRLKAASKWQKSYVDLKRQDIEYNVGDNVFLKVFPWKKIMRFGRKEKLSPCFIGSYEILGRVSPLAYRLALPLEFDRIHNVFYVSMLRRYRLDPSHILPLQSIEVSPGLAYDEKPMAILAKETKQLRNKQIPLVRVLWRNHSKEEATWEREEDMRRQHPYMFRD